jgi:lipoate synthase
VVEYVTPEGFDRLAGAYRAFGFAHVAAAPFVRSSYNAEDVLAAVRGEGAAAPDPADPGPTRQRGAD